MHWSSELATALTVVSCLASGTAGLYDPAAQPNSFQHNFQQTTTTSRGAFCDTLCQQVTDGSTVTSVGGAIIDAISGSGGRVDIIQGNHIITSTGGSCGFDTSAVWKLWAQAHEHAFANKLTQFAAGGNAGSSRVCIDSLTLARLTAAATQCYNTVHGAGGSSGSSWGTGASWHESTQWQTGTGPMGSGNQGGQTGSSSGSGSGAGSGGSGSQTGQGNIQGGGNPGGSSGGNVVGGGQQGSGSSGGVVGGGSSSSNIVGGGQQGSGSSGGNVGGGSSGGVIGGGSSGGNIVGGGQQGGGSSSGIIGGGISGGVIDGGFQAGGGQQVVGGGSSGHIVGGGSSSSSGGSTSSTSSGWGHGNVHSQSICFKIKSKKTDRFLTTYGSEYAFARLEGYYSVFKAYPSKNVASGFTLTEVNRNGGAVDYPVKQMTGTGVFKPLYGDKDAVWTFNPAAFGDSCWGVAGKKMAERQDWGGWGKNYREASSGEDCVDIELEEATC